MIVFKNSSNSSHHRWKKLSELTGIDESQLRRLMINRKEFTRLLSTLITEASDEKNSHIGILDDDDDGSSELSDFWT